MENNKVLISPFDQTINLPFSVTFSYKGQYREVKLKNGEDVLKLANIFEKLLKNNNIECEVIETSDN